MQCIIYIFTIFTIPKNDCSICTIFVFLYSSLLSRRCMTEKEWQQSEKNDFRKAKKNHLPTSKQQKYNGSLSHLDLFCLFIMTTATQYIYLNPYLKTKHRNSLLPLSFPGMWWDSPSKMCSHTHSQLLSRAPQGKGDRPTGSSSGWCLSPPLTELM